MLKLKAFVQIAALQNNDPEVTSLLGELSDRSSSFARDKQKYTSQVYNQCELVVFETSLVTPDTYVQKSLEYSQWIYTQALLNAFNTDVEVFKSKFLTQFGGQFDQFECGVMVTARGIWMPAYIKFRLLGQPDNSVRLWYADKAFQAQCDSRTIIVVAPITPVDTLMNTTSVVAKALQAFTLPAHQEAISSAAGIYPFTKHRTMAYTWYAPDDSASTLTTYWSVVIYGGSVVSDDIIRDAIADYILANTTYTRDQWLAVFPDIFAARGFTVIPYWHKHSTYDATPAGGLYSPFVNYSECMSIANTFSYDKDQAHNASYLQSSCIQWKSLAALFISNKENDHTKLRITDIYDDYAMISTSGGDFNRMSPNTTDWVRKLIQAVIIAESYNEYSILDDGFYNLVHNDLSYIMFTIDNIDYMVLTRESMLAVLGD